MRLMKLIDAVALKELLESGADLDFSEAPETLRELLHMIDYQEVIDAVPVVRCRDCRYYHPVNWQRGDCEKYYVAFYPEDYCSYGKTVDDWEEWET